MNARDWKENKVSCHNKLLQNAVVRRCWIMTESSAGYIAAGMIEISSSMADQQHHISYHTDGD
jgi:hypothetical protein